MEKQKNKAETAIEKEEAKVVQDLLGLLERAKIISLGVASERLEKAFGEIPRILEQSKRVEKARSEVHSKKFREAELMPFMINFVLGLSEVTHRFQQLVGVDEYLDIRGKVAEHMARQDGYGECGRTYYQLDLLFESFPKINENIPGHPGGYQETLVFITTGLKMFIVIEPGLEAAISKTRIKK